MKFFNINLARTKKGVSIIELLIVILVIGILASTISVVSIGTQKSARDAKRKEDAELILNALSAYAIKHGGTLKDIVGTYPSCSSVATPVDTDATGGNDACQAFFYSTPTPITAPGANRWSVLETYLQPYVGSTLPIDPKNKFNDWSGSLPNYGSSTFSRNGYYFVSITDREVPRSQPSCSWTFTASYYFETAPEDKTDSFTNSARNPSMSTSSTSCQNYSTIITIPR